MKVKIIKLSDQQTVQLAHQAKKYVSSVDYNVLRETVFTEQNNLGSFTVYQLEDLDNNNNLYVIKTVHNESGETDYKLCFVPDHLWYEGQPGALASEYAAKIPELFEESIPFEIDGEVYNYQLLYEMFGESSENKLFGYTCYYVDKPYINNVFIRLEHGALDEEKIGGFVQFLQGCELQEGEIECI